MILGNIFKLYTCTCSILHLPARLRNKGVLMLPNNIPIIGNTIRAIKLQFTIQHYYSNNYFDKPYALIIILFLLRLLKTLLYKYHMHNVYTCICVYV